MYRSYREEHLSLWSKPGHSIWVREKVGWGSLRMVLNTILWRVDFVWSAVRRYGLVRSDLHLWEQVGRHGAEALKVGRPRLQTQLCL